MLFCIKVKPMHKEAESFSPMILLLLFPYSFYIPDTTLTNNSTSTIIIHNHSCTYVMSCDTETGCCQSQSPQDFPCQDKCDQR